MTVLDERECGMALITKPAKTVLILLIRVPSIFFIIAPSFKQCRPYFMDKNVSPSLTFQRHLLVVGNVDS
jgi:hypothetical protein